MPTGPTDGVGRALIALRWLADPRRPNGPTAASTGGWRPLSA